MDTKSSEALATCVDPLVTLFTEVDKHYPCRVLEGYRSPERQLELYNNGASKVKIGKHNKNKSEAADVAPMPINWNNVPAFYYFAGFVMGMAAAMKIRIRWGGDWDSDKDFEDQSFNDLVHFEAL